MAGARWWGNLRGYEGHGRRESHALLDRVDVCEENGLPYPTKINGFYICGTVKIHYFTRTRLRLNPVFCENRHGRYVAFIYHI